MTVQLPIVKKNKEDLPGAVILTLMGLIFTFPFFIFLRSSEDPSLWIFMLPFLVVGLIIFFVGIAKYRRTEITVTKTEVNYLSTHFIYSSKNWTEPLKNYRSIFTYRQKRNKKHYNCLVLVHSFDTKKNVEIYASPKSENFRQLHEAYCRILNLSFLGEDVESKDSRNPEDLDKSIQQLKAEGKIIRSRISEKTPPDFKNIHFYETNEGCTIQRSFKKMAGPGLLFYGSIGLLLFLNIAVPAGILFVLFIFGTLFTVSALTSENIIVTPKEIVRAYYVAKMFTFVSSRIPVTKIEQIDITPVSSSKRRCSLDIESDRECIYMIGIKQEEAEWLKDKLLYLTTEKYSSKEEQKN